MVGRSHHGAVAPLGDRGEDPLIVGGNDDIGAHSEGTLYDTDDHRLTPDIYEGLTRESGRGVAGGYDGQDAHSLKLLDCLVVGEASADSQCKDTTIRGASRSVGCCRAEATAKRVHARRFIA